jgi:hypothetical protein
MSKKNKIFDFSTECVTAFEKLKDCFLTAPVLRHFDPKKPIHVSTDGSDFALCGVVQQADENGDLHPVSFFSRKFAPAEINYEIHDKELLGTIETFKEHCHWSLGSLFPILVEMNTSPSP